MKDVTESTHPSVERLRTFGLGQLDEAEASAIEEHVSHCEACCRTLAGVGSDTFIDVLRITRQPPADGTFALTAAGSPAPVADGGRTSADAPASVGLPPELLQHPRYRILALLGAGGMGAVYKAEHRLMNRVVALKVMNRAVVGSAATVERFRREFRASALLSHPNIVAGYDAEQAGDVHFLIMEYVEGTDLARCVAERGPLPTAEACDYVRQAALGLQHAHEHGMIHRDVKPHNLMRTPDGTIKVLDFGLARLAAEAGTAASGVTGQGTLLGTVDYLAPEQADDARQADIRSDIYSLGCTLYFLLSGQPPFPQGTVVQKIMAHTQRQAESLHELRPDLPPGLTEVVERMMAKSPEDRYQTPDDVWAALAPFVGQTVVLNPASAPKKPAARPQESGRSRRRWRVAVAALLLALGGIVAGAAVYRIQTDNGELLITTESDDVEVVIKQGGKLIRIIDTKTDKEIKLTLRSGVYELELKGAPEGLKLSIDNATLTRGETVLAKIERKRPARELPQEKSALFNGKDLTGWVVDGGNDKVWRVEHGELVGKHVDQSGYDPCWLLTEQSYSDFRLQLEFKLSSGTNSGVASRAVPGEKGRVDNSKPLHMEVQILDDAKYRRPDGKVDSPTGSLFWNSGATYLGPEQPADLKPIGDWNEMVVESRGDTLQVWVNGRRIQNADLHKLAAQSDALPGLKRASGRIGLQQHTGEVRFRNVEIRGLPDPPADKVGEVRRFEGHRQGIIGISYAPDGRHVLSTSYDLTVRLWDVASGKEVRRFEGHTALPYAAVLSPDGRHVLSGGDDLVLRIWDAKTGKELRQGEGHTKGITWIAVSPNSRRALTGSWDGTIRLWKVESGEQLRVLEGHTGIVQSVAFSPDGKRALSASNDKTVRLWDLETGKELRSLEGHTEAVMSVAFSPDSRRALSGSLDKTVRLWDVDTGKQLRCLEGHTSPVFQVAFTPDGRHAFSAANPEGEGEGERGVRLWDLETGKELSRLETGAACRMAVSPDGRYAVLSIPQHTDPRLWRLPDPPAK